MLIGYDTASTPFRVPGDAQFVVCYADGTFKNDDTARSNFPDLVATGRVLPLTVRHGFAVGIDIEPGNDPPSVAPAFMQQEWARGEPRPILYADGSDMDAIVSEIRSMGAWNDAPGLHRRFRLYRAHPNGIVHVCAPDTCGCPYYCDMTQFWWSSIQGSWRGFVGDLDVNACRDDFFTPLSQSTMGVDMQLSAVVRTDGRLEVFAINDKGDVFHTWQRHDTGVWHGTGEGEAGKIVWEPMSSIPA